MNFLAFTKENVTMSFAYELLTLTVDVYKNYHKYIQYLFTYKTKPDLEF